MAGVKHPNFQKYFTSPEASATLLHSMLVTQYGDEVYDWDPQTILLEVRDDYGIDMAPEAIDRWSAMQLVLTTDLFFTRVDAFLPICKALATGDPMFGMIVPVSAYEVARSVVEVALNRPMIRFNPFVVAAIRGMIEDDGLTLDSSEFLADISSEEDHQTKIREVMTRAFKDPSPNAYLLDQYVLEELKDIISQLDEVPKLDRIDDILLSDPDATVQEIV